MPEMSDGFSINETHGMLLRPGVQTGLSSDRRGWESLYASTQREIPFEDRFHAVDDQLIVLHLDGPVAVHRRIRHGEDSRVIAPGGMFMVPGGMDFGVRLAGSLQTLHLYVRRSLIEEVAESILTGDPAGVETLPRFGDSDPLLEQLMLGVRDALNDENPSATPYVDYLARAIAARLIRCHSPTSQTRHLVSGPTRLASQLLTEAVDFMEANLDRSIGLATIARATGLSPTHFARQFRLATGRPPHRYLMRLRIERAMRLLRETHDAVAEIAYACGFANQEHMTRLFRQYLGTTPAAWRRTIRG